MKHLLLIGTFSVLIFSFSCGYSQDDKSQRKSPPAEVNGKLGSAGILINYSQPSVNGRTIWGDLVPYGEVWRTGANEATYIEITNDIMIEGKKLKAGKYSVFTIPGEKEWTIIFNSEWKQWGAYKYNDKKDVLRVNVSPENSEKTEMMTFSIEAKGNEGQIILKWDELMIPIKISQ